MKSQRALLLSHVNNGELSRSLHSLIAASPDGKLQIETLPISSADRTEFSISLESAITRIQPVLIFLVALNELDQTAAVLDEVKRLAPEVPILVVLDSCEAADVFALIEKGAAEFITAPLKASDLLPRTWRLLRPADSTRELTNSL